MSLVARFLNGPHAGQDIAITEMRFILEMVMHQPLICDITEPPEPVMPAMEIAQYRYVGSDGDVLYYTLNREMTHAMERNQPWRTAWSENYGRLHHAAPDLYRQAQQVNPWAEDYNGTSIMESIREHFRNHPAWRPTPGWLEDPEATSPDSMVVRFSEMSKEAEAEMDAWKDLLHG